MLLTTTSQEAKWIYNIQDQDTQSEWIVYVNAKTKEKDTERNVRIVTGRHNMAPQNLQVHVHTETQKGKPTEAEARHQTIRARNRWKEIREAC